MPVGSMVEELYNSQTN